MSNTPVMKYLLVPLSIRNTLKSHHLNLEDLLCYDKVANIFSDRMFADLVVVNFNFYRLLPNKPKSFGLIGRSLLDDNPSEVFKINSKQSSNTSEVVCDNVSYGYIELFNLAQHYCKESKAAKFRFEEKINPIVDMIRYDEMYVQFLGRMFKNKSSENGSEGLMCAYEFRESAAPYTVDILRDNFTVITFNELEFPNEEHFFRLVQTLLNLQFKISNYEEMVAVVPDLFTCYFKQLKMKHC